MGEINAVYTGPSNAILIYIPNGMGLPKYKRISLVAKALIIATININIKGINLTSRGIFLDNLKIKKLHKGNNSVLIPNTLALNTSLNIPPNTLKGIDQPNGQDNADITALINITSGFMPKILK